MTRLLCFCVAFVLSLPLSAQKREIIPQNSTVEAFLERLPTYLNEHKLSDLRVSDSEFAIRIWQRPHEIVTLSRGAASEGSYKIFIKKDSLFQSTFNIKSEISSLLLDSIISLKPFRLKDEKYYGIDGSFVFIEMATKISYKIVGYWSPKRERSENCRKVMEIMDMINRNISVEDYYTTFWDNLESGSYRWWMTTRRIDRLLDTEIDKTDLYTEIEQELKGEFNVKDMFSFPIIVIDEKQAQISDLNRYYKSDIDKIEIYTPSNSFSVSYGTSGQYGVIRLTTKRKTVSNKR